MQESAGQLTPQQRGALRTNSGDTPLAKLDDQGRKELTQLVMQRVVNGERLQDIAETLGVHRTALNAALLKYAPEEWKDAQVARAIGQLDDIDEQLERADNILAIARAEKLMKSAHWKLERLHRRLFGTDIPVDSTGKINIQINLGGPKQEAKVIDPDN